MNVAQEIKIGVGILNWNRAERICDRYGSVHLSRSFDGNLFGKGSMFTIPHAEEGRKGTLVCRVLETRDSPHVGDLFRGFSPSRPEVGEEITLGTGTLFYEDDTDHGTAFTSVGLKPDDERETDWLDPQALYRVHVQKVELIFLPSEEI